MTVIRPAWRRLWTYLCKNRGVHSWARFHWVSGVGSPLAGDLPLNPPSPGLRRTGREHVSTEALAKVEARFLQSE